MGVRPTKKPMLMGDAALTPAEKSELSFLKRMVNEKQDAAYSHSPASSAKLDLYYARDELKEYVSVLRVKGRNI